jgi:hypothetical protein
MQNNSFILSMAEPGHHGELLAKFAWAWFNDCSDELAEIKDNKLKYKRVPFCFFGKQVTKAMFFATGQFDKVSRAMIEEHALETPGKNGNANPNDKWPIVTTIHMHGNKDMHNQISLAEKVIKITPYLDIDSHGIEYCRRRHIAELDLDDDDISYENQADNINQHYTIANSIHFPLINDIMNKTNQTYNLFENLIGPPVSSKNYFNHLINIAHESSRHFR